MGSVSYGLLELVFQKGDDFRYNSQNKLNLYFGWFI